MNGATARIAGRGEVAERAGEAPGGVGEAVQAQSWGVVRARRGRLDQARKAMGRALRQQLSINLPIGAMTRLHPP